MAKKDDAAKVTDLTNIGDEDGDLKDAVAAMKRNMSDLLISSSDTDGPVIDFGEAGELKFKSKIPVTAMNALVGSENKVEGLQLYIRRSLADQASKDLFDTLVDDLDVVGLSGIVEFLTEAVTPFPTK